MRRWALSFLATVTLACQSGPDSQPLPGQPLLGQTVSSHQIHQGQELVGRLDQVDFPNEKLGQRFLVHNVYGQLVGFVDAQGRAYRYNAQNGKPEHVSTSTMIENIQAILRIKGPLTLTTQ